MSGAGIAGGLAGGQGGRGKGVQGVVGGQPCEARGRGRVWALTGLAGQPRGKSKAHSGSSGPSFPFAGGSPHWPSASGIQVLSSLSTKQAHPGLPPPPDQSRTLKPPTAWITCSRSQGLRPGIFLTPSHGGCSAVLLHVCVSTVPVHSMPPSMCGCAMICGSVHSGWTSGLPSVLQW